MVFFIDISNFVTVADIYVHNMFPLLACKTQYGGGPTLSHDDCCWDCLIDGARNVVSADTYRDRRESLKQLARDVLDGNCEDGKYYVSRPWYDCKYFLMPFLILQEWIKGGC